MIKYFCDGCETEIPEPYGLYTLGFALCRKCYPKFVEKYTVGRILVLPKIGTKLDLHKGKVNEETKKAKG